MANDVRGRVCGLPLHRVSVPRGPGSLVFAGHHRPRGSGLYLCPPDASLGMGARLHGPSVRAGLEAVVGVGWDAIEVAEDRVSVAGR